MAAFPPRVHTPAQARSTVTVPLPPPRQQSDPRAWTSVCIRASTDCLAVSLGRRLPFGLVHFRRWHRIARRSALLRSHWARDSRRHPLFRVWRRRVWHSAWLQVRNVSRAESWLPPPLWPCTLRTRIRGCRLRTRALRIEWYPTAVLVALVHNKLRLQSVRGCAFAAWRWMCASRRIAKRRAFSAWSAAVRAPKLRREVTASLPHHAGSSPHTPRAPAHTDSLFASPFPRMHFALPQPGHTRACRYFTEHCAVRVRCGAVQRDVQTPWCRRGSAGGGQCWLRALGVQRVWRVRCTIGSSTLHGRRLSR